jgi:hypothetical protein
MPLYQIKYKPAGETTAKTTTIVAPDHNDAEQEAAKIAGKGGEVIFVDRSMGDD